MTQSDPFNALSVHQKLIVTSALFLAVAGTLFALVGLGVLGLMFVDMLSDAPASDPMDERDGGFEWTFIVLFAVILISFAVGLGTPFLRGVRMNFSKMDGFST